MKYLYMIYTYKNLDMYITIYTRTHTFICTHTYILIYIHLILLISYAIYIFVVFFK